MTRYRFLLSAITFIALTLCSCAGRHGAPTGDFSREVYTPQYAQGFSITSCAGGRSVLISVNNPWQGADSITTRLLILRDGEKAPEEYDGQTISSEAHRIITMSSTHVAMLDAVGCVERVVGVSGADFISSEYICAHRDTIGDVGYDGNINYEVLVALRPDIVLLYGVNGASSMEGKLKELGIAYMYVADYLEQSPLGKAEWMVALAELTGRRAESERLFGELCGRYNDLKASVADSTLAQPKVMFNMPYGDAWFMPSDDSYAVQLVRDAGGEYVYSKMCSGNASATIDIETAYMLTAQADVWINTGRASTLAEVGSACPKMTDTRCFSTGAVYNNNRRTTPMGGNDYYESAIVHPDLLLRDLVKIFHPELVTDDFVYYLQLH